MIASELSRYSPSYDSEQQKLAETLREAERWQHLGSRAALGASFDDATNITTLIATAGLFAASPANTEVLLQPVRELSKSAEDRLSSNALISTISLQGKPVNEALYEQARRQAALS